MRPLDRTTVNPDFLVRPYEAGDREAVRRLCCDTGFLGHPIDPIFSDRELFADYLTRYYTDVEPESSWVGVKEGRVVAYLLCGTRWRRYAWWSAGNAARLAARGLAKLCAGRYDAASRRFIRWILWRGWRESPYAPPRSAHMHFNALPEHRRIRIVADLVINMLEMLRRRGVPRVYGQIAGYEHRRTDRLYEYLGWKVVDKREITKYRGLIQERIHLCTVVKDLSRDAHGANSQSEGRSR